jgi:hypothetical protein
MPDSKRPSVTDANGPAAQDIVRKTRKQLPELDDQVRQVELPVLDQPVAAVAVDEEIPVLEETFAEFEKTLPVLE